MSPRASFDVFSWQTVERKAAFINQVTKGQVTERSVDDVGDQALSYAEVKALATGNPLIMERAGVSSELTKLEPAGDGSPWTSRLRLARRAESSEREAAEAARLAQAYRAAAARAIDTSGERFAMVVAGRPYRQRAEAGAALREALLAAAQATATGARRRVDLGQLGGFSRLRHRVRLRPARPQ
jgi:hypothetical protein